MTTDSKVQVLRKKPEYHHKKLKEVYVLLSYIISIHYCLRIVLVLSGARVALMLSFTPFGSTVYPEQVI